MMPQDLKPRVLPQYVPLDCQVHSCKRPSVAYCLQTYTFVCDHHRQEFCIPDKHRMLDIEDALKAVIKEAISNEKASRNAAAKYAHDAIMYEEHLSKLRWDKQAQKGK